MILLKIGIEFEPVAHPLIYLNNIILIELLKQIIMFIHNLL